MYKNLWRNESNVSWILFVRSNSIAGIGTLLLFVQRSHWDLIGSQNIESRVPFVDPRESFYDYCISVLFASKLTQDSDSGWQFAIWSSGSRVDSEENNMNKEVLFLALVQKVEILLKCIEWFINFFTKNY